jgi:hypothetical protein
MSREGAADCATALESAVTILQARCGREALTARARDPKFSARAGLLGELKMATRRFTLVAAVAGFVVASSVIMGLSTALDVATRARVARGSDRTSKNIIRAGASGHGGSVAEFASGDENRARSSS